MKYLEIKRGGGEARFPPYTNESQSDSLPPHAHSKVYIGGRNKNFLSFLPLNMIHI